MNMPGFAAEFSVVRTSRHFQREATRDHGRGGPEVTPQQASGSLASRQRAEWIRGTVGFGRVVCTPRRVCIAESYEAGPTGMGRYCTAYGTIEGEPCYWWPY
jgi:hypothetical protein